MAVNPTAHTRVVWALRRAFLAVEAEKELLLRGSGLTGAQYAVVINVHRRPGTTGADLARAIGVSPQAVAGLVARLEAVGLLRREHHPGQAKTLGLHLTDEGTAALRRADAAVDELERRVVAAMGEEAAALLRDGLDRLARDLPALPVG